MTPDKVIGTYNGLWMSAVSLAHRLARKEGKRMRVKLSPSSGTPGCWYYTIVPLDTVIPWKK